MKNNETQNSNKQDAARLKAEEELRKREADLDRVQELAHLGSWSWDVVTDTFTWSKEMFRIYGVDPDEFELNLKTVNMYIHPGDLKKQEDAIMVLLGGGKIEPYEYRIMRPDGKISVVLISGAVVDFDAVGSPTRLFGVALDITERKKTERLLKEKTEQLEAQNEKYQQLNEKLINTNRELLETQSILQTAMDQSDAGIAIADAPDGNLRYVNDAGLLMQGGTRESIVKGVGVNQYVASWQLQDLDGTPLKPEEVPLARAIMYGETNSREFIIQRGTGEGRTVIAKAAPVKSDKGNVDFAVVVFMDITDLKHTEAALRESQKRLELATESAELGIWDWDIVNNIMLWNDNMFRLYGITHRPENYGVEIWQTGLHPDDIAYAWEECQAAMRGERKYDIEFRVKHSDGTVKFIKATGIVLRDDKGRAVRMIGINRDITYQKQAEEEQLKYEHQLQLNSKLESLGLLAGGIAHDFNNLMSGLFGYIDLAKQAPDKSKSDAYLTKAINTIDRARGLTAQLLTFAKGGAPLKQITALFPFIQETATFALSGSKVICKFDIDPNLWLCNIDKNQLGQVIENLIINAHQAMPLGDTIELSAQNIIIASNKHVGLAAGNYVKISIKDFGVGIAAEYLSRIFDPFFTTKEKGHGLGLATCYSIINRHGGVIKVQSEPEKGSTFYFYLPASPSIVEASTVSSEIQNTRCDNGTVIIMDDEDVISDTVREMLESLGYTVEVTTNGRDVIDLFRANFDAGRKIDWMIFDITVPGGMGGQAAVAQIRKLNKEIPVFVMSGYAEEPAIANPAEYGFTASICKPFSKPELVAMLDKNL